MLILLLIGCQWQPQARWQANAVVTPAPDPIENEPAHPFATHVEITVNGRPLDEMCLVVSEFEYKRYLFIAPFSLLRSTPKWAKGSAFPPLPPKSAEAEARTEASRLRPDVRSWRLQYIKLRQFEGPWWFYVVCLSRSDALGFGSSQDSGEFEIPVLMDGKTLNPTVDPIR